MKPRLSALLLIIFLITGFGLGYAADPTVGSCTRRNEFPQKQEEVDKIVLRLAAEKKKSKRKKLVKEIVKKYGVNGCIENLIRYREPHLIPVFIELLKNKQWPIRARALYALKMIGNADCVEPVVAMLKDKTPQIRELAANALANFGDKNAKTALEARKGKEKDEYVLFSIEAAIKVLSKKQKPYDEYKGGQRYEEKLVGPKGAKRVEWAWVKKGANLFNDYDAKPVDMPVAKKFVYPVSWYKHSLFSSYPRNSFGAGGNHAGEDFAWFREGCSYYAIANGVVRMIQGAGGDWGFLIVVEHKLENGNYICAIYGHTAWDVLVEAGDIVKCGQKIGTQGLSCSVENGGYGSHVHFGIGNGPFRRPKKLYKGDKYTFTQKGREYSGKILRFLYADEKHGKSKNSWLHLAMEVECSDGKVRQVVLNDDELSAELSWLQAYIRGCKGWLNPQKFLPEHVEGKKKKK